MRDDLLIWWLRTLRRVLHKPHREVGLLEYFATWEGEMTTEQKVSLEKVVEDLRIGIEARFVPYSRSLGYKVKPKPHEITLNWKIELFRFDKVGKPFEVEYHQGIGHLPGYKPSERVTIDVFNELMQAAETGKYGISQLDRKPIPAPKLVDVLYCLVNDAEALEYITFEDWAREFGTDADSRSEEKVYQACLTNGLKLRALIRDEGISKLREAYQEANY